MQMLAELAKQRREETENAELSLDLVILESEGAILEEKLEETLAPADFSAFCSGKYRGLLGRLLGSCDLTKDSIAVL